jgi:hypothetical protein
MIYAEVYSVYDICGGILRVWYMRRYTPCMIYAEIHSLYDICGVHSLYDICGDTLTV